MKMKGVLLFFSMQILAGPDALKKLLEKLKEQTQILDLSSIYKRLPQEPFSEFDATMEGVIKGITVLGANDYFAFVKDTHRKMIFHMEKYHIDLKLLSYDDFINMTPELTLPYPGLHVDPLIIRCASEVWGQYEHPIFKKSLSEISKDAPPLEGCEFFLQGKKLLGSIL